MISKSVYANTKIILPTGLALFAMFFGAGNMLYPLSIGNTSGQFTWIAALGFLISGVGMPFIGLFAGVLYEGDYWTFFSRVGKIPALIIVTFLILMIGPLVGIPRTETLVFNTLLPMLPNALQNIYIFDLLYFFVIYLIISNKSYVVDIIGWILAPVKIITFTLLVILGLYFANPMLTTTNSATTILSSALVKGYGTMDLLAALFFCSIAYKNIQHKCHVVKITSHKEIMKMSLYSCIIGASLISVVYTGFIFLAAVHARELQGVADVGLLGAITSIVMGRYGVLFVGVCVTFACLTTASALTEVTIEYVHEKLLMERIPRFVCVVVLFIIMYSISVFGFDRIMEAAWPLLKLVYPPLILLCMVNIYLVLQERKHA